MDTSTAIGLGIFALIAIFLGWFLRMLARVVTRFANQAGPNLVQNLAAGLPAAPRTVLPRRPAARPAPPRSASPQMSAARQPLTADPGRSRPLAGSLLGSFQGGTPLLQAIIVAEALAPPVALRQPQTGSNALSR